MLQRRLHIAILLLAALPGLVVADAADDLARGVAQLEAGRLEQAEATFRELISRHPELPAAYNNLAVVLVQRGRFEEAQATLDRALQSDPDYGPIFRNLQEVGAHRAGQAYSRAFASQRPTAPELELITEVVTTAPTMVAAAPVTTPSASGTVERSSTPPVSEPDPDPEPAAALPQAIDPLEAALATVESWRSAWSEQDVDGYLAAYSRDYQPRNMTRDAWLAQRRERLLAPASIQVTLSGLAIDVSGDQASVGFRQRYRSDSYEDEVRKTLTLRPEDGAWRIVAEISEPLE